MSFGEFVGGNFSDVWYNVWFNSTVYSTTATVTQTLGGGGCYVYWYGDSSTQISINGGSWLGTGSSPQWVSEGSTVCLRHTAGSGWSQHVQSGCNLGMFSGTGNLESTTPAADTDPSNGGWSTTTGANPSTQVTSPAQYVSGINTGINANVHNGTLLVNDVAYYGQYIYNGDKIQMRNTSSASYGGLVSSSVTLGTGSQIFWHLYTRAADTTPDAYAWTDVSNQTPSATIQSNTVTITGLEAAATMTFATSGGSAHQYRINGGAWNNCTGSPTISNGQTLQLQMTLPASPPGASANITTTIGGVSDQWSGTISTQDKIPDQFTFNAVGAGISSKVYSNIITLTGIDSTTDPASFATGGTGPGTNKEYRKYTSGAWGAWATVSGATPTFVLNDKLQLRMDAPSSIGQTGTITPTIGGISSAWTVTAEATDVTPSALGFVDTNGVDPLTLSVSNTVTVAGINAPADISISGGEYSINGGAWTSAPASAAVYVGDQVQVRATSGADFGSTVTVQLTIGTLTSPWNLTVRTPNVASIYVVTFRETPYGAAP